MSVSSEINYIDVVVNISVVLLSVVSSAAVTHTHTHTHSHAIVRREPLALLHCALCSELCYCTASAFEQLRLITAVKRVSLMLFINNLQASPKTRLLLLLLLLLLSLLLSLLSVVQISTVKK